MNLLTLTSINYPVLSPEDSVMKALNLMSDLGLNKLPVIRDEAFEGFVTDEQLLDSYASHQVVDDFEKLFQDCQINAEQHYYDAMKIAVDCNLDVIAVLDRGSQYLGIVWIDDIVRHLVNTSSMQSEGGVLVLSIEKVNYALQEICQIIESESIKILSIWTNKKVDDPDRIIITIKTNAKDISPLLASMERYGYHIEAEYQQPGTLSNDKHRLDNLLKYLDI